LHFATTSYSLKKENSSAPVLLPTILNLIVAHVPNTTPIRVLIADDNAQVRRALASILSKEPDIEVAGYAIDGLDAVQSVERLHPHIVLMDLSMPQMDGIQATMLLPRGKRAAKVLIVTQYDQDEYIRRVIESGASGYILKQSLVEELAIAIRTIHDEGFYFTPAIANRMAAMYATERRVS
jgi:DNA-binding NarL/FixJ family response regulator